MSQNVNNQNSNLVWSVTGNVLIGLTAVTFVALAVIPYALPLQIVSYSLAGAGGGLTALDIIYIALRSRYAQKDKAQEDVLSPLEKECAKFSQRIDDVAKQLMKIKKNIYQDDLKRAKDLVEDKALKKIPLMTESLDAHVNNNQAISSLSIGLPDYVDTSGFFQAGLQILAHTTCFDYALVRPLEDGDQRRVQNMLWNIVQEMRQGKVPGEEYFKLFKSEFENQFGCSSNNEESSSLSHFFDVINQWSVNLEAVIDTQVESFNNDDIFVVETKPLAVVFKRKLASDKIQLITIKNEKIKTREIEQIHFPTERTYVLKIVQKA